MTRRGAIMAGAAALVLAGLASVAFAKGHSDLAREIREVPDPHGAFAADTDYCGSCHIQHDAKDEALSPYERDRQLCLQCHSGQSGVPDILAEYAAEGSSPGSMGHSVPPSGKGLACTQCHTPHQSSELNPGLLRTRVVNRDNGRNIYLYNSEEGAIGNGFCYSCHGPERRTVEPPPPGPLGDFTAFEAGAHSDFARMSEAAQAEEPAGGETASSPTPVATVGPDASPSPDAEEPATTGEIACLFCHGPHDSENASITTAPQEELCFRCHSRADPNTAGGTSPYRAFNAADNTYGDEVRIYHHPIAGDEQQDGARTVECVSCHNPHFDAATAIGNNAKIANPRRTTNAWPVSATKRGDPAAVRAAVRTAAQDSQHSVKLGDEPVTYGRWARALLKELDAPNCQDNLITLVAWQVQEGTSAIWNPLATTYSLPGAASINTSGVKDFASMAQGLEATRLTLTGGSSWNGYEAIVAHLKACAPAMVTAEAVRASAWCRGCTLGRYLTGLLGLVQNDYASFAETLVSGSTSSFEDPVETVNAFCTMCHISPDETNPIERSDVVPYGIHLVNDEGLDPGGQPHDLFEAAQFEQSLHAGMACTACHDVHGSSNAYALRETIAAPDGTSERAMAGFTGADQPEDRDRYASFCLSCHPSAEPHVDRELGEGSYCRECHFHGSERF